MRLIATRQIYSREHGTVLAGEIFDWPDEFTANLLATGAARRPDPPVIRYETKPAIFETPRILPEAPGVSARDPFCDMPVSHAEPKGMVTEGDPVLPESDLRKPGIADLSRRRRRERFGSR